MNEQSMQMRLIGTAQILFDQAHAAHRLPAWARQALILAAETLAAAYAVASEDAERVARNTVLGNSYAGLEPEHAAVAACAAIFQRAKLRSHREAAFIGLGPRNQARSLRLAAILQLARALAKSNATAIFVKCGEEGTTLYLDGEHTVADAAAERWRATIGTLLIHSTPTSPMASDSGDSATAPFAWRALQQDLPPAPAVSLVAEGLQGDEPAAQGARRVLRRFFERMLAREDAVLKGEDSEDVHQMRVATRRLRASLQVVEGLFGRKLIRHYRRGLQQLAQALGSVRDADVFLIALREYRGTLTEPGATRIDPLIAAVTAERAQARIALLADLKTSRYLRFKRDLARFLTTHVSVAAEAPATGIPPRIRDIVGSVIWRRYEDLRAFEVVTLEANNEMLHSTRIAGKRLRYTLEFFADAIGPRVEELLDQLTTLQEHLGAIQDAATARTHITRLGMQDEPGAQSYINHLATHRATLIGELPQVWGKVAGKTYQRKLFEAVLKV